ncbi:hypothetical protein B0T21DRAFT_63559 [Apiosordaria backusii]|uniref:Uncharacterized protein n=1 Tax=Apiosordaria backusii TaxID=314023 RepID=A0AA40DUZ3_9PEZI|nr:hypothetical protein B0T21DRAFT_63559 [Apiosordaria backusii]
MAQPPYLYTRSFIPTPGFLRILRECSSCHHSASSPHFSIKCFRSSFPIHLPNPLIYLTHRMSTITRTWQEQERLRIEKEKENERKRLEQERERARIEQQKEAERKRVESERAQREKERIASLRAAAATKPSTTTRPTPTTSTMQTTSLLPLPSPHAPLGPTTKLTIQPTAISSRITNTIRVSVIPIDPGPSTSSLPGVVACGQSGYFNCAPEYGGGCCPVGFACGKGELCVSPQLEKDKPLESLPCPGYRGYFACKEDIGGRRLLPSKLRLHQR